MEISTCHALPGERGNSLSRFPAGGLDRIRTFVVLSGQAWAEDGIAAGSNGASWQKLGP
jgi:hypothetical protein